MEESWFYHKDGQQHGPVDEGTLRSMFASGELSARTLVWKSGMSDWKPAGEVDWFISERLVPPPVVAPPPCIPGAPLSSSLETTDVYEASGPQVRPWVRYWARFADVFLFALVFGFVMGFIYPPITEINGLILGMIVVCIYVLVESIMLSSWGTTPGKALFRIRLRRHNDEKLTFAEAMGRSLRVWSRGQGLAIPVVALITNCESYHHLLKTGAASWDSRGNFTYSHQTIGPARVAAAIVLIGICFALTLWQRLPD